MSASNKNSWLSRFSVLRPATPKTSQAAGNQRTDSLKVALPALDSLAPAADPERYARATVTDLPDGRVQVKLETRPFRAHDGHTTRGLPSIMAPNAWERPASRRVTHALELQPCDWTVTETAVFDHAQVAEADAELFDYSRRALTFGGAQAEHERAVIASKLLGRVLTERLLRELGSQLHGAPGRDYALVELRTSFLQDFQTICVHATEGGHVAHITAPRIELSDEDMTFERLLDTAEQMCVRLRDRLLEIDAQWFEDEQGQLAVEHEAAHQRALARQTADVIRASVHAP